MTYIYVVILAFKLKYFIFKVNLFKGYTLNQGNITGDEGKL